jgi:hypothetical protein
MAYFAHSVAGRPEEEWEPLARHLAEVAGNAANHAQKFGCRSLATAAGYLHDLGKYGPEFQARLRDPSRRADHSTAGRILERCAAKAADLNFPFANIAAAMRFIDDVMVPVIAATEDEHPGEVQEWIRDLRFAGGVGAIARKLGRYTVGVPRSVRAAMIRQGVAEVIREEEFGDQFVVLHNLDLYTRETGLCWDDIAFRSAESLIVG